MKFTNKRQRERLRLLGHLARQPAVLEWPCENPVLWELVEIGEVALGEHSTSFWNGRDHSMRVLRITNAGRAALAGPQESK